MNRKITGALIISLCVCLMPVVVSVPPANANPKFIIASWDYPDEYGQGIETFDVYENSTGSWVNVGGPSDWDESGIFDWNASVAIKLKCWTWFNSTLTGVGSTNEGKLYQQHNVIVTQNNRTIVFSQQNFTYSNVYTDAAPMWLYVYEIVLNFLPVAGQIYTITIDYEVYYEGAEGDFDYDVELASDIDDDWWRTDTGPTHYIDTTTVNCRWSVGFAYEGQMRFQLNIPKDAIITSATVTMYDSLDSGPTSDGKIWRIDEDNVGSLEADSSFPAVDDSEYASITWDGLTGWDTYTITDLVQTQVNLSGWSSGNYIGLRFNFTTSATSNNVGWYDFEHANDYHPYLNVTYTAPVIDWNIVSTASLFFSVPLDYWALNMGLVFGGLIIMLFSVCLMAVKVRDRTITNDSGVLLFFLFCVGWGLFIGGTIIG